MQNGEDEDEDANYEYEYIDLDNLPNDQQNFFLQEDYNSDEMEGSSQCGNVEFNLE